MTLEEGDTVNPNSTDPNITRVVVVGGGYAGVLAANRLQRPGVDITLVNPRPDFVERIRLHQMIAGTHTATVPYADVLAPASG